MTVRSKDILSRPQWSLNRALLKSMGYTDYDMERPLIGIANSWNTIVPGHYNLKQVSEYVRQGIYQAGGTPVEFGVLAGCDGVASGHEGNRYILPTRDMICLSVEAMVEAHKLDAVVLLGSCDKIVPGMLMAAARLDVPALLMVGGPSEGGCEFDGRSADITSLAEGLGMLKAGHIDEKGYNDLEESVMPTCGSCSFLGTANSMCCVAEGLGLSLPGSATIPAVHSERLRVSQQAGRRIVEMVHEGLSSHKIINRKGIENALRLSAAISGSTNVALHLPAVAHEAGVPITMQEMDELFKTTPHVAKIYPASAANVPQFHAAGGVPAVLKEIMPLIHGDAMTVTGRSQAENIAGVADGERNIIRPLTDPWSKTGGLAVLSGNLAPETAITKPGAIDPSMQSFTGKARCFDSEEEANQAIMDGVIQEGDVVVIRYEGPKGGPGMREMALAMKMLYGRGLALKTALITDGRFSGTNNGCFVGHISPEAADGGPLAVVQDGDEITIDVPARDLRLHVSDEDIKARLEKWIRPKPKYTKGLLGLYSQLATSANRGAVLKIGGED
jgi:dihydroxy-acid dehydratase